mmetsp:Transcript_31286/g.52327  ORF Transcript_31286/g.52327 Transcript_31286/m.52327 type:complete len:240 (+) Transcript_31286:431-1150(+)
MDIPIALVIIIIITTTATTSTEAKSVLAILVLSPIAPSPLLSHASPGTSPASSSSPSPIVSPIISAVPVVVVAVSICTSSEIMAIVPIVIIITIVVPIISMSCSAAIIVVVVVSASASMVKSGVKLIRSFGDLWWHFLLASLQHPLQLLHAAIIRQVGRVEKRVRRTLGVVAPRSTTNAMHIVLHSARSTLRKVEVNHILNVLHIQPARSHVRRHQNTDATPTEFIHRVGANGLRLVSV